MKKIIGVLCLTVMVISGCATVPSPEAMRAATSSYQLPQLPEAGKAIVYVVRPNGLCSASTILSSSATIILSS